MAKAHGTRPDNRTHMAMEGFAVNYVLRGRGTYREENGRTHALVPGRVFQRLPGRLHSTAFDPASDYAELFLVLDAATAKQLLSLGLIADAEVLLVGGNIGVVEAFGVQRRELQRPESELTTRAALGLVINFLNMLYEQARRTESGDVWESLLHQACTVLEPRSRSAVGLGRSRVKPRGVLSHLSPPLSRGDGHRAGRISCLPPLGASTVLAAGSFRQTSRC